MSSVSIQEPLENAIKQVHSDSSPIEWVVATFLTKNTLGLVASGECGTLTSVQQHFAPEEASFALIRYPLLVDNSRNTRFAFVDWTPDSMKPMRKALVSMQKTAIRAFFEPFHVELLCSDPSDIQEEEIHKKIGIASGTLNLVVDDSRKAQLRDASKTTRKATPTKSTPTILVPTAGENEFQFAPSLSERLSEVRNDDCELTWVVCGYSDECAVTAQCNGNGDLNEMLGAMDRDKVQYALGRFSEVIDGRTEAIRFVFVSQMPQSVSPLRRGRISTYSGAVRAFFKPFHYEFAVACAADELSEAAIKEHAAGYTGTLSKVVERGNVPKPQVVKQVERTVLTGTAVRFEDEEKIKAAIKSVHSDETDCDWTIVCLNDQDKLEYSSSGCGGFKELSAHISESRITFILLRVTDRIDSSLTVKFAYILIVPSSISPMKRARFGTMSGACQELFRPMHVDFVVSDKSELSDEEVKRRIGNTSGSRSNVVAR